MKLFITGFIQVFFVAVNTFLISKVAYTGVLVTSFAISFIWTWNVKKVVFGDMKDRITYASGAAFGAAIGLFLSVKLFDLF